MAKNKNHKNYKKNPLGGKKFPKIYLPEEAKKWVWGILIFVLAAIFILAFFDLAGIAGKNLMNLSLFLIGKTIFIIPLIFIIGGLVFFVTKYKKFFGPTILAILILILGICGTLQTMNPDLKYGGWLGFLIAFPFLEFFSGWVSYIIFGALIVFGVLIFWYLLKPQSVSLLDEKLAEKEKEKEVPAKPSLIKKIFSPNLKVKEIEQTAKEGEFSTAAVPAKTEKMKEVKIQAPVFAYQCPPLDLLDSGRETPTSGDIRINSAIIKKTLQNFDIPVEMSEVNIGPTVTQYTLKPAEGVKLSKITSLSNDLALSLAAHPIRIEAPIPGRSLVGIEIPNRVRAKVRLKDLISNPIFQGASSSLTLVLGRDVSGSPVYTDLAKMPHLLVAGSTGTGKTIFLNSLILSLIYRNSPEILSLILVDPKRVEFAVYNELPHLLAPVIFDAPRAVNVLKWLILEMERRFQVLSAAKARDIDGFNQQVNDKTEILPYIVLIVDELADLMAAKGREMEAGVVRLAQMARAVGIHLVLATQRPSVEVITGLIKANITARVTFQVASQVDSRTILDSAGAEKLLGQGDLLFLSAEIGKPKRIQGSYVSDKEVKRVTAYIKSKNQEPEFKLGEEVLESPLREDLEKTLEMPENDFNSSFGDDPLYDEAKRVVIESKKASASLLQRRLRLGYARAARLIDMLEEKGVVGPGEGAKPREVFLQEKNPIEENNKENGSENSEEDNGWRKV